MKGIETDNVLLYVKKSYSIKTEYGEGFHHYECEGGLTIKENVTPFAQFYIAVDADWDTHTYCQKRFCSGIF